VFRLGHVGLCFVSSSRCVDQVIFLTAIFGYLGLLIFYKWGVVWNTFDDVSAECLDVLVLFSL
jgi:hypothetical protein